MTVNFKHAYYSVSVRPENRKWLQFIWDNDHYQFTSCPQGLSFAPRLLTKFFKPALIHLRKLGMLVLCYIDNCIFNDSSKGELLGNVKYALHLYDLWGLTIQISKLLLVIPMQVVEFLGAILNLVNTAITLPEGKINRIWDLSQPLLRRNVTSIHDLTSFTEQVVFAGIAVP